MSTMLSGHPLGLSTHVACVNPEISQEYLLSDICYILSSVHFSERTLSVQIIMKQSNLTLNLIPFLLLLLTSPPTQSMVLPSSPHFPPADQCGPEYSLCGTDWTVDCCKGLVCQDEEGGLLKYKDRKMM